MSATVPPGPPFLGEQHVPSRSSSPRQERFRYGGEHPPDEATLNRRLNEVREDQERGEDVAAAAASQGADRLASIVAKKQEEKKRERFVDHLWGVILSIVAFIIVLWTLQGPWMSNKQALRIPALPFDKTTNSSTLATNISVPISQSRDTAGITVLQTLHTLADSSAVTALLVFCVRGLGIIQWWKGRMGEARRGQHRTAEFPTPSQVGRVDPEATV